MNDIDENKPHATYPTDTSTNAKSEWEDNSEETTPNMTNEYPVIQDMIIMDNKTTTKDKSQETRRRNHHHNGIHCIHPLVDSWQLQTWLPMCHLVRHLQRNSNHLSNDITINDISPIITTMFIHHTKWVNILMELDTTKHPSNTSWHLTKTTDMHHPSSTSN